MPNPEIRAASPAPRHVILYPTCLVDTFFPEVGEATVHLIERMGAEVHFPEGLSCCSLPHFNNGFREESRRTLLGQLDLLEGDDPIIIDVRTPKK